ncbi:hypothetical protein [Streptomyces sp. LS1784]|uniref:hypothetical protein n=1 Tax=Streptomyces sp. LS1784 TaxID=2851533 RepID=UPI001CC9CD61|nr:hypothetical protein [Streptomyces sp. LS1784]
MNLSQTLVFLDDRGTAEASTSFPRVLRLYPNGEFDGAEIRIMARPNVPLAEQLTAADRILAAVQEWRDSIADEIKRSHTTADELAATRARIAELERAAEDGPR